MLEFHGPGEGRIKEVKVKPGSLLSFGKLLLIYQEDGKEAVHRFKSGKVGRVEEVLVQVGQDLRPGAKILKYVGGCSHPTIMKDMCAECGADLRKMDNNSGVASVAMVHSIPELKVSSSEAANIGLEDQQRLVKSRKLVLLVDLDQTLIHTTNDNIPPNIRDVYHFQLYGPRSPWYHTRIRPRTSKFLENISHLYEFHICTFGARLYAHTIAAYLDPKGKFFSHRILSRDECFDARSKTANMGALFPCGDNMVCIIDDREDVWNFAPNLIHVRPYHFFKHTGDINAPPGLTKQENDEKEGIDFDKIDTRKKVVAAAAAAVGAASASKNDEKAEESSSDDEPEKKPDMRRESIDMPLLETSGGSTDAADSSDPSSVAATTPLTETSAAAETTTTTNKLKNGVTATAAAVQPAHLAAETEKEPGAETEKSEEKKKKVEEDGEAVEEEEDGEAEEEEESLKDVNNDLEMSSDEDSRQDSDLEDGGVKKDGKKEEQQEESFVEVEDTDDYLLYLEDILKTVHKAYYDLYDQMGSGPAVPDLKTVIPYVKRKVLQGVRLVFSGVVPTQVPLDRSKPFLLAKSLGASIYECVDEKTTHLVAARLGTAKVSEAKKRSGVSIVTPDWLWACAERWEKVDERLYPLGKSSHVTRRPPAHCSSPEIAFAERCAEIDLSQDAAFARQPSVVEADPFLAFSTEDIEGMDKEVEDILSGESDSDEDGPPGAEDRNSSSTSEEDSLSGDMPRGHKRKSGDVEDDDVEDSNLEAPLEKFQRGEDVPSDFEVENQSDDDGQDEDWSMMGAELERELGS